MQKKSHRLAMAVLTDRLASDLRAHPAPWNVRSLNTIRTVALLRQTGHEARNSSAKNVLGTLAERRRLLTAELLAKPWTASEDEVMDLIRRGADPNAIPPNGYSRVTVLAKFVDNHYLPPGSPYPPRVRWDLVKELLDVYGADPNKGSHPPLTMSTFYLWGPTDIEHLKMLLDAGANPNQPDRNGDTALSEAASNGRIDAMKLLLARGADLKVGNPPLIAAACGGNGGYRKAVKFLLDLGCDVNVLDEFGSTALYLVERDISRHVTHSSPYLRMARLLRAHGGVSIGDE